jgi:hypothetical protein
LGVSSVSEKARDLEQMGRNSDMVNASNLISVLEREVSILMNEMRAGSGAPA